MSSTLTATRVNLGCGELPIDGYLNVDQYTAADLHADARTLDFHDLDEVICLHMLEHLSWADAPPLLERIRGWLRPGGRLVLEVPDMEAIMANPGPNWVIYIYGAQSHDGEYHKSGYTAHTLAWHLRDAGFENVTVQPFASRHPWRYGMACLEAIRNA